MSNKTKFYAVKKGRKTGIFYSWDDCKQQIEKYPNAVYKSFFTEKDAQNYLKESEDESSNIYSSLIDFETEEFQEMSKIEKDVAFCFVDGSFHIDKGYSCGVVIFLNGKIYKHNMKGNDVNLVGMRNVAGEILGAMEAVKYAEKLKAKEIVIYHDYAGINDWPAGNWEAKNPGTIDYVNFINTQRKQVKITFVKVEGHSGVEVNEMVDKLAKAALGI